MTNETTMPDLDPVPPPVPFDQLPADVQAQAFDSDGNVVPLDYDG